MIFVTKYDNIQLKVMKMKPNIISKELFSKRFAHILSNSDETTYSLAEKLGMTPATISRYANGIMAPKLPTVYSIADIFKINPLWLMGYDDVGKNDANNSTKSVKIPVLGIVQAGLPIGAVENIIDYEEITEEMARQGEFFGLKIRGDSMEPKFSEGDVVIVRKQSDVDSGTIAIVMVNGDEATVKKIQKFDGGINLVPSNGSYDIKTYTNEMIEKLPVRILGKVVELRAKF